MGNKINAMRGKSNNSNTIQNLRSLFTCSASAGQQLMKNVFLVVLLLGQSSITCGIEKI